MTDEMMSLRGLLEKSADADLQSRPDSFGQFPAKDKWIACRLPSGIADAGRHAGRA